MTENTSAKGQIRHFLYGETEGLNRIELVDQNFWTELIVDTAIRL